MENSYTETLRSLERNELWPRWTAAALVLAGAWAFWMFAAQVDVYARATHARVELNAPPSVVAALEGGRIAAVYGQLGESVEQGQVLLELESSVQYAQLALEQRELARLHDTAAAYRAEIAAEQSARAMRWRVDQLVHDQSRIEESRARVAKAHQDERVALAERLFEHQAMARIDAARELAERSKQALELTHAELAVARSREAQQLDDALHAARIAQLERALLEIEGEQSVRVQAVEVAQIRLEQRTVRATQGGKLGTIGDLQVGAVIPAGHMVATIVPADEVHLVAEFRPEVAMGRIARDQEARVSFEGFSFFEYGFIPARVARIATETRGASVRVELELEPGTDSSIPLQHALPSSVDVRIERATPWALVLRSLGRALLAPRAGAS